MKNFFLIDKKNNRDFFIVQTKDLLTKKFVTDIVYRDFKNEKISDNSKKAYITLHITNKSKKDFHDSLYKAIYEFIVLLDLKKRQISKLKL